MSKNQPSLLTFGGLLILAVAVGFYMARTVYLPMGYNYGCVDGQLKIHGGLSPVQMADTFNTCAKGANAFEKKAFWPWN